MKKGYFLLLFSFLFCSFSYSQYVTLEGRQFKDENGNDFYPVVCNFMTQYLYTSSQPEPFFPSPDINHDLWCYNCISLSTCLDQIQRNFDTIAAMNFNAIRLFCLNPVYYNSKKEEDLWIQGWGIKVVNLDTMLMKNCWIDKSIPEYTYTDAVYLSQTFGPDTVLNRILQYYDSVLLRAARSSLKVLLNVGVAIGDFSPEFISGYHTYLALVADHFGSGNPSPGSREDSIRKALMAYVILEEPAYSWNDATMWPKDTSGTGHTKQDVCQFINTLYDALKQNDPYHLVTLGGVPADLFEYDPGVMKLDFYSPHIYPKKRTYPGYDFLQGMVDEAHSWFYWLASNVPMPYLIGETGFKSKYMDDTHVGNDGTNTQQKQYADSTLKSAKECLASGYSWWYYQDYYWSDHDCYYGLLGRTGNQYNDTVLRKPVVTAFENFNSSSLPGIMTRPEYYYDPYHHEQYAPGTHIIAGHIIDDNGPVKDAWVRGITYLGKDTNDLTKVLYDTHYSFSNNNGYFDLIPYDYYGVQDTSNCILDLKITAPSGLRFHFGGWTNPPTPVDSGATYCLMTSGWEFDDTVKNSTVPGPGQTSFQAFNSLDLQDVSFLFRSECDVFARTSVFLHPEVVAYNGSETHIFCGPAFPDCSDIPDTTLCIPNPPVQNTDLKSSEELELAFIPVSDSVTLMLYPNPCKDAVVIELLNADNFQPPYYIAVYNSAGARVASFQTTTSKSILSMASLSSGIYLVQIKYADKSYSKSIIKNE